jgi:hypothetical protein
VFIFFIDVVEGDIEWKWLWKNFASTNYDKSKETGQCGIFQSTR